MDNNIYINQLGYTPNSNKYFLTTKNIKGFKILSGETVVFNGTVKLHIKDDKSTQETLYIGKFSDLKVKGEYVVELDEGSRSYKFSIRDDIYNEVLRKTLKSYYFQRCGTSLLEECAGDFKREACHTGETSYHKSTGLKGSKDVSGGWHDAGDYGRYITPGAVSLASMLTGYELSPEKYQFTEIGLPEKNGKPDFYNEMRYELDWMFKMQEMDKNSPKYGALHYMINSKNYCWAEPHRDSEKQYIMDYCSIATADFAAIMACASRVFNNIDKEFADKALKRSLIAWSFIENNPSYPEEGFLRPDDINTGGYAEDRNNNIFTELDKLWPAAELFLTTGDEKFHKLLKKLFKMDKSKWGQMSWQNKCGFAELKYLISKNDNLDKGLKIELKKRLLNRCSYFLENAKNSGFKVLLNEKEYYWGSNSEIFSRALQLLVAYKLEGDEEYKSCALDQLNYILGLNINGISFISGLGSNYTNNIHNASFDNDGIDGSFPGMLPGGPNMGVEKSDELFDKVLYKKCPPGTAPGKCYIDDVESFSSNENCITYSAPLVSVAAFFSR